jgi:hypothetical protein
VLFYGLNGNKITYFGSSWVNSGQNNFFTAVLRYKSCQVYFVTAFCSLDGSEVTHYCSIVV